MELRLAVFLERNEQLAFLTPDRGVKYKFMMNSVPGAQKK
jgi:hypothetical protein